MALAACTVRVGCHVFVVPDCAGLRGFGHLGVSACVAQSGVDAHGVLGASLICFVPPELWLLPGAVCLWCAVVLALQVLAVWMCLLALCTLVRTFMMCLELGSSAILCPSGSSS